MSDVVHLPSNIDPATARLPEKYEFAKMALAECSSIDECANMANKAEALASYAKQANDPELRQMADRIQARAVRRCGELLKEIEPARGANQNIKDGAVPKVTRESAATDAGLSERQRKTAIRVANVPTPEFEKAVESSNPPTVTNLAQRGTSHRPPAAPGRNFQWRPTSDGFDLVLGNRVVERIKRDPDRPKMFRVTLGGGAATDPMDEKAAKAAALSRAQGKTHVLLPAWATGKPIRPPAQPDMFETTQAAQLARPAEPVDERVAYARKAIEQMKLLANTSDVTALLVEAFIDELGSRDIINLPSDAKARLLRFFSHTLARFSVKTLAIASEPPKTHLKGPSKAHAGDVFERAMAKSTSGAFPAGSPSLQATQHEE